MNKKSILIIDDEERICEEMSEIFRKENYNVDCVFTGKAAKKYLLEKCIDIVLLDLKLPDVNGLDLVDYIKAKCSNAYIIVITAYADMESAIEAIRKEVFNYIVKPINPDIILKTVSNAVNEQKTLGELKERITELEKFREIATGRELKMIELKEEVARLKKKLGVLIDEEGK